MTATYLDAILQHRQWEFVCGVAREPKSEGWVHAFPRCQNLLPEIRQVHLDPVLGEVTVLQYHPSAPPCRRRNRGVCRWALKKAHHHQVIIRLRGASRWLAPGGSLASTALTDLALAERQRDPGCFRRRVLLRRSEPLDVGHRVGARREEHDERARRLRLSERLGQVERRRQGEVSAQVGSYERPHGRQNRVGPKHAQ